MAAQVDGSSPPRVAASGLNTVVTTAGFNPPMSNTVLCAATYSSATAGGVTFSISDNTSGALAWNPINLRNSADSGGQSGAAALFYALLDQARTGLTVTSTITNSYVPNLKIYVLTGIDLASPVGGINEGSSTAQPFNTTGLTVARAGSIGIVCAEDTNGKAMSSSDTTYEAGSASGQYGLSGYKGLGAAGASATFQLASGSGSKVNWVSAEFKAALPDTTGGNMLPFCTPCHHFEPADELAGRRTHRRPSGLLVPRRELTVARAA